MLSSALVMPSCPKMNFSISCRSPFRIPTPFFNLSDTFCLICLVQITCVASGKLLTMAFLSEPSWSDPITKFEVSLSASLVFKWEKEVQVNLHFRSQVRAFVKLLSSCQYKWMVFTVNIALLLHFLFLCLTSHVKLAETFFIDTSVCSQYDHLLDI